MCHFKPVDRTGRFPAPKTRRPIETEQTCCYLQKWQGSSYPGRNHGPIEFQEPVGSAPGHSSPPVVLAEETRRYRPAGDSGSAGPDHNWSFADARLSIQNSFPSPRTARFRGSTFAGHAQASSDNYGRSQDAKIDYG